MKPLFRFCNWTVCALLTLMFVERDAAAQTSSNEPVAVPAVPARSMTNILRSLPGRSVRISPRRNSAGTNDDATATETFPLKPLPEDLSAALAVMSFDRTSEALFETVRRQQSGGKLTEPERFRLAVLLGDWSYVGTTLKSLPVAEAMKAYTRLLDSLAANSQSASQFFPAPSASRNSASSMPQENPNTPRPADRRSLFLSDDFYAVIEAAPADLTSSHLTSLTSLIKTALGAGGRQDFLVRLEKGLKGIGGDSAGGRKLAAQLLSSVGWMADAGRYLPLKREEWNGADTFTLVLTLEYFTQIGVERHDEAKLQHAAEVCAFLMQTSRFGDNDKGLFRQATDRFVKLLPALEPDAAEQLIRENFLTDPVIMVDLILALGEAGQQAQRGTDLPLRAQSLATQSLVFRVIQAKKSALPEAINVLVMNWLGEADQTCRSESTVQANPNIIESPFVFRSVYTSNVRREPRALTPEVILSRAPSAALVRRLNQGLAQRVTLTLLKVNLMNPKEPVTLETLTGYLKEHPGQEKELCQEYLTAWTRKRTVPAEDPNIVRMRQMGYQVNRQTATGIPLTRLRQNQNISDFKTLLTALRGLTPEPLDAGQVIQSFMAIHSGAEVYRLEDIEAIFGSPEKMDRGELMGLVTGMRSKLREQWRDPAQQQEAGTNRSEDEAKDEVSHGYRTALELVRRGLVPEKADWKQFIVRGQLFFDASEYEFGRQIKLVDYVNLRDEAFHSYEKAASIYAGELPDMPRGQWTMEPYQMWFFVMLGASDLSQLTRAAARSDPGLKLIGDAMRALPGPAAEGHLKLFGQMLGDLLSQVPGNMRQRFLSAGLQVVGEDQPSAKPALEALNNYKDLLAEIELRMAVDGPTSVARRQPFGVFVSLEHTRQLARESGGFSKYLQNLASQSRSTYVAPGSPKPVNYRDEFAKNIHAALDETFEVSSITFSDPSARLIDLPRDGWQETPLAYLILNAKDASVDRIPSVQLDMDFSDQSGQVVLPVRSQVETINANGAATAARPCEDLALTLTLDEREWRDGKVVVEAAAKGHGVIPSHEQMFDYQQAGLDVEVSDNGLSVAQLESDGHRKLAAADRGWQFKYRRKKDVRGDVQFHFPSLKPGIKTASVEHKHYEGADLVPVNPAQAMAGIPLHSTASSSLRIVFIMLGVLVLGVAILFLKRLRPRHTVVVKGLAVPDRITPFTVAALLRRIQRDYGSSLDKDKRESLTAQIRQIEAAFFSNGTVANGSPDLENVARKWVQTVG